MDTSTAHKLNELNQEFYSQNAASFSATRSAPWEGWKQLVEPIKNAASILDIACGNMRFEQFATSLEKSRQTTYYCVDSCPELAVHLPNTHFQKFDVVDFCIENKDLAKALSAPTCDLTVSFGFFHHVPGFEARQNLLKALVEKTAKGGLIALSFWCFMDDEGLARKAKETTRLGLEKLDLQLDDNDYLLGWQKMESVYRYCHSFTDNEIKELVGAFSKCLKQIDSYRADGKFGKLNKYLIFECI